MTTSAPAAYASAPSSGTYSAPGAAAAAATAAAFSVRSAEAADAPTAKPTTREGNAAEIFFSAFSRSFSDDGDFFDDDGSAQGSGGARAYPALVGAARAARVSPRRDGNDDRLVCVFV